MTCIRGDVCDMYMGRCMRHVYGEMYVTCIRGDVCDMYTGRCM